MKFLILSLLIAFQANLHADEVKNIEDPKEIAILEAKLNKEAEVLDKLNLPQDIKNHLQELENKINSGEVQLRFQSGTKNVRGSQIIDEGCGCSIINLSKDYIDSGVISTLIHEFEHVKQDMLLNNLLKVDPELDKLTDIFGEYYFNKNEEMKKDPLFKKALFVGSALLFYMEYGAFKKQIQAINAGVKDSLRKEKTNEEVMESVANDYLIAHSINVDEKYIRKLATLADSYSITDYIIGLKKSKSYQDYFLKLQD